MFGARTWTQIGVLNVGTALCLLYALSGWVTKKGLSIPERIGRSAILLFVVSVVVSISKSDHKKLRDHLAGSIGAHFLYSDADRRRRAAARRSFRRRRACCFRYVGDGHARAGRPGGQSRAARTAGRAGCLDSMLPAPKDAIPGVRPDAGQHHANPVQRARELL